ncbi:hypothetical protein BCY76_017045 [Nesterenkonia sp. PF2B19]|nr:hypothetical protein BCY76_017045 [Nesterenkonia sp. PF2B19]
MVLGQDGTAVLHAGLSGVQPLYVEQTGDAVHFATQLDLLLDTATSPVAPDWTGWAQIIGIGAPLAGRTTPADIDGSAPWSTSTSPRASRAPAARRMALGGDPSRGGARPRGPHR